LYDLTQIKPPANWGSWTVQQRTSAALARRAAALRSGSGSNVALIYRHWSSKKALYLDILRAVWLGAANEIAALVDAGPAGAEAVVSAYLDAMLRDQMGAQILIREYLDGAPHLAQLALSDPALLLPVRRAASGIAASSGGLGEIDPVLSVVTVGGMAALVVSAQEAARPFIETPLPADAWRRHVHELLLHGLAPSPGPVPPVASLEPASA
jgi:TetR/AcrR family transcriptional regulator